ncbi:MAG: hypothetical protein KDH96_08155 [Candidatus Riesia sp.]|nr:hypothetical protein [Candidatus Riesia sp.]
MNILYLIHNGEEVVVAPQPFLGNSVSTAHTVTFRMSMSDIVDYMKQNNVKPEFQITPDMDEKLYVDHFVIEDEYLNTGEVDSDGVELKTLIGKKAVSFLK